MTAGVNSYLAWNIETFTHPHLFQLELSLAQAVIVWIQFARWFWQGADW